ncbi:GNAT family N-acetyltransferase [Allosaccharopolyspora coralli]|uniref:GNAT family N-acetyltransferase n=1 Tax=Allosaccharopolyspora coralli TaxID=2665642 RepID=A0A5Q3QES0_9PSEU|nr:GNAT family N-acetyltransferase [Allosaccharopolyspora coralli]QGK69949.1 GNAT family N-acetyltransferase [Allosaccharopolyspora coralli]
MSATVQPAQHRDADALTRIVRTSAAYAGGYQAMVADDTITTRYLEANRVRVARTDAGGIAGFTGVLVPGRGEPGEWELDYLFVADDVQGHGIGSLLLDDLCTEARAADVSRVHIVSHPPAEAFYLRYGARRVGTVPGGGSITWQRPHLLLDC